MFPALFSIPPLIAAWRRMRGTTLVAPLCWTAVAIVAVAAVEEFVVRAESPRAGWIEPARFAAALTTLCPLVALLGARRPQNRAWQAIVVSFWGVLVLPAGETWLVRPGEALGVHPLWQWFMAVLLLIGLVNWLGTRYWMSGVLAFFAQWSLMGRWLPVNSPISLSAGGALALAAAALILAWIGLPSPRRAQQPLDRVCMAFRDQFGLIWGLRIAQGVNAAASLNHWDVQLSAVGLRPRSVDGWTVMPPELQAAVQITLLGMLRRFVSDAWLTDKLTEAPRTHKTP